MNKIIEKSNVSLASERGFSFRAVNHDSAPIYCQDGVLQEIFPGVYVTVDPVSGIGLIEVNPEERTAKLLVNGQDVLDIVQVTRRDVLSIDGRDYVFLKYMDAYFNQSRVRTEGSVVTQAMSKVVPFSPVERQKGQRFAVRMSPSLFQRMPKRTKILAAATAVVTVMSMSAIFLFAPKSSSSLEERAGESKVVESVPANPVKKAPATINDLIEDEEKPASAPEPLKKEIAAESDKQAVKSVPSVPLKPTTATWIKPTTANKVTKISATPTAPAAPAVSEAAMKSFENDYQEAVLIKGYDQERSTRILKQLQKKVPAGTALRQKIEKELR
jgi:hypothetical protein